MANKIDISPIPEIAKNIYELAKNIESCYGLNDISLKGIGIDGYFVGLGLAHVFREKYGLSLEVDPVEINSGEAGVTGDKKKLDSFVWDVRKERKQIILVDKRRKSGALCAWVYDNYPRYTYAVLVDANASEKDRYHRADISATEKDFPWIRWSEKREHVYENAFEVLGLKIKKNDEEYEYIIEGPIENYLLDALYREIDLVVAENE